MTLTYALYFQCPECGQQIDVGESTEEVGPKQAQELAKQRGMQAMEGTCPGCETQLRVPVSSLRSRVRN